MKTICQFLIRLGRDHRGATALEYALILVLITLAVVGAITAVARSTNDMWNNVSNAVVSS